VPDDPLLSMTSGLLSEVSALRDTTDQLNENMNTLVAHEEMERRLEEVEAGVAQMVAKRELVLRRMVHSNRRIFVAIAIVAAIGLAGLTFGLARTSALAHDNARAQRQRAIDQCESSRDGRRALRSVIETAFRLPATAQVTPEQRKRIDTQRDGLLALVRIPDCSRLPKP
jgi:uncharacterized protein HemX